MFQQTQIKRQKPWKITTRKLKNGWAFGQIMRAAEKKEIYRKGNFKESGIKIAVAFNPWLRVEKGQISVRP